MIHTSFSFAFFGTPEPAVEILEILRKKGFIPALIVTNPDKPKGRNLKLTPPPVKVWALARNIPVIQPEVFDESVKNQLSTVACDVFIVVAYGSILPKHILDIPKRGSLNIHYSLLPKYRGASPVESQILADDREVGVSILLLDEKMDHGPIVAQRNVQLTTCRLPWPPTSMELRTVMNKTAGELLAEVLSDWVAGKIEAKSQDHSKATYTKKFTTADREIRREDDAYQNYVKIQALAARGTYFLSERDGKKIRVSIKSAEFKNGKLIILRVVPEGKKEMSYEEFVRGLRYSPLGQSPE
jgi:methionyl-tRNA formyltransferase